MAIPMNIERMASRLLAIYGWQPLGVVCVVLLLFALSADYFYAGYESASEDIAALEKKSREMKRKVGQQKQMEVVLKEKQSLLEKQREKGFVASTPELAGPLLLGEIQNLATASQIKFESGNAMQPRIADGFALLQVEGRFAAQTRQLVAFLESAANSSKIVHIEVLKVAVQDAAQPAMLSVQLMAQGFYAAPQKGEKSSR